MTAQSRVHQMLQGRSLWGEPTKHPCYCHNCTVATPSRPGAAVCYSWRHKESHLQSVWPPLLRLQQLTNLVASELGVGSSRYFSSRSGIYEHNLHAKRLLWSSLRKECGLESAPPHDEKDDKKRMIEVFWNFTANCFPVSFFHFYFVCLFLYVRH